MRIVINHLTRMTGPRICIAGIDPDTAQHVRPTTPKSDLITRNLLQENGGPVSVGALVELGKVIAQPSPPESEDHLCATANLSFVRNLEPEEYLQLLDEACASDLEDAFGFDLDRVGRKYAVTAGSGSASLAVVKPYEKPTLEIDDYGKLQVHLNDEEPRGFARVTDARFFEADQKTIRADRVEDVQQRIRRGVSVYLMLGLAQAWQSPTDDRERHWLQVNGLCLVDRPVGDRP